MAARQLPQSKEAEMAVLGAIFLNSQCFPKLQQYLKAEDFFYIDHKQLYTAYGLCMAEAQDIDLVLVKEKLEQIGQGQEIDVQERIRKIVESVDFTPSSESDRLAIYARCVKDLAKRRRMIAGYEKAKESLYDQSCKVKSISNFVLQELMNDESQIDHVNSIAESGVAFLEELERRKKSGDTLPGISTGYEEIDLMTGGFEPGKVYVIGGRPSMGKTALGLNFATNIAEKGNTVMIFSLEMRNYEIMKRIISSKTRIKSQKLKTAKVTDDDFVRIAEGIGEFYPDSVYIDDNGYQTIQSIANTCYAMNVQLSQRNSKIDCIMIDHLQLLSSATGTRERRLQIGEMTRGAKLLANKLKCPIILLSQLSRLEKNRKSNRPQLSDVRESGDIEQDADVVFLLHREECYKPTEENHGKAELIVAKNRDGETGTLELGWDKTTTTFMPWDEYSAVSRELPKLKNYKKGDEES